LEIGYDVSQVRIELILATTSNINQIVQRIGRVLRKYEGKNIALIYVVYVPDTKDDNVIEVVKKAVTAENEEINIIQKQRSKKKQSNSMVAEETLPLLLPSSIQAQKAQQSHSHGQTSIIPASDKSKKRRKETTNEKVTKKENVDKRIFKAYGIVESTLSKESLIVEANFKTINTKDGTVPDLVKESLESEPGIYKVKSSMDKGKIYLVNLEKQSCTCNDFIYRHVKCKHILATEIISPKYSIKN